MATVKGEKWKGGGSVSAAFCIRMEDYAAIAVSNMVGCSSRTPSSRHSRNMVFAHELHLPQQVPTLNCSRNCGIEVTPESTARRILVSETLWQTQIIMNMPCGCVSELLKNYLVRPNNRNLLRLSVD